MATPAPAPVEYPETDGRPLAETDRHRRVLNALSEALDDYFSNEPDVHVSGNLLLYPEEGNPAASVAPDVLVVRGLPKGDRKTYLLWVEGKAPNVVVEVTSKSTRFEGVGHQRALYAFLGVREYFQFDPLGEYLDPPLRGYRLTNGDYAPIERAASGALVSQGLGLELRLEDEWLRLIDPASGERLLTPAEQAQARRVAEARAAELEEARRAADARAAAAETQAAELAAKLARLRAQLGAGAAEPRAMLPAAAESTLRCGPRTPRSRRPGPHLPLRKLPAKD
ncbi:MAG: Uma2 family endonuclease [Chloroflexi bacterium]|nr:Uma2 family endonuclease [Chloroflexota bacterium]